MNAPRAWEMVLEQLALEMPKASFDTWVRDTAFVSFADGTYRVGTKSDYARDWLESRLSSTCARQLSGILNQAVTVQFTVANGDAALVEPATDAPSAPTAAPEMRLSIARDLQELFTKPDRALYFPGYWLRWIPYVGTAPFLTVLAFRQALYQLEGCFAEGLTFDVSAERVGAVIGVQRQTIARQRDEGKLDWFLSHQKTEDYTFDSDGRPTRQPFRYAFKQSPITPADMDALLEWLLGHGLDKQPLAALDAAIAAQPRDLIRFPNPRPTKLQLKRRPGSAQSDLLANVLAHCPAGMDPATREQVVTRCGTLKSRLMDADGLVKVPLYFLNHYVPWLGSSPALALIVLRKRAYHNSQTGEIRETVRLSDGYGELAVALGLTEGKVREFMPVLAGDDDERLNRSRGSASQAQRAAWVENRRGRIQTLLPDVAKGRGRELLLTIRTRDPLAPDHQAEYDLALRLLGWVLAEGLDAVAIEALFDGLAAPIQDDPFRTYADDPNQPNGNGPFQPMGNDPNHTNGIDPNQSMGVDPNRTTAGLERFTKSNDIKILKFNYLNPELLKDLILQLTADIGELAESDTPVGEAAAIAWASMKGRGWSFSMLCPSARLSKTVHQQLLANSATPEAFVAHLLHAFSPAGVGLKNPVRYAVAQLLRPGDGALGYSPVHDRLAALGPDGLQALIRGSEPGGYPPTLQVNLSLKGARDWERLMGGHRSLALIHELGEVLGLMAIKT